MQPSRDSVSSYSTHSNARAPEIDAATQIGGRHGTVDLQLGSSEVDVGPSSAARRRRAVHAPPQVRSQLCNRWLTEISEASDRGRKFLRDVRMATMGSRPFDNAEALAQIRSIRRNSDLAPKLVEIEDSIESDTGVS